MPQWVWEMVGGKSLAFFSTGCLRGDTFPFMQAFVLILTSSKVGLERHELVGEKMYSAVDQTLGSPF